MASAGAGWPKIGREASSAPGGLDQQHLFFKRLAKRVAELKLRSDLVALGSVPDRESALAVEVFDPHVIPHDPVTIGIHHVGQARGQALFFHQIFECPLSAVFALRIYFDRAGTLHVGLPGENKHLQLGLRLACKNQTSQRDQCEAAHG